jgi:UDP-N-acetylmuramyl pentapeptide phosphotransferase/UDP-N-acetylglucosamine-1-phosphate transferase
MLYLLAFLLAFGVVYTIIPYLKKLSEKTGFVDMPTERKKHEKPVPLLGGVGIFLGFIPAYFIFASSVNRESISVLIGSLLILGVGMVDDWYKGRGIEFPALPKFLIQISAAIIVYSAGIVFRGYTNPFTHEYIVLPGFIQFVLSIMWILGVTTVINFMDGMDGLAGSLSAISGSTLFVVALAKGHPDSAMMAIILVGATIGFLRYNRHPAQIFMGDSGATFLGFMLGIIALDGAFKQTTMISIFIPLLALGVPIFDNLFVVLKRFVDKKPVYQADAGQIHYRLLSTGLSQKQVVMFICLLSVCLNLISIILLLLKV